MLKDISLSMNITWGKKTGMDRELPTKFKDEPYGVIQTIDLHDSHSLISKVSVALQLITLVPETSSK